MLVPLERNKPRTRESGKRFTYTMRAAFLPEKYGVFIAVNTMKMTVKGLVTSVPVDAKQCRIAVHQGEDEYRIIPKAAGIDLEDEINVSVEASGDLVEEDEVKYLTVRKYKVLEDDGWDENE